MATPRISGRELAMQVVAGWTLGFAASAPTEGGVGSLAPLHQMLIQEMHGIADSAGLTGPEQQAALAEATQVLDQIFLVAERVRTLSSDWNAREDS